MAYYLFAKPVKQWDVFKNYIHISEVFSLAIGSFQSREFEEIHFAPAGQKTSFPFPSMSTLLCRFPWDWEEGSLGIAGVPAFILCETPDENVLKTV